MDAYTLGAPFQIVWSNGNAAALLHAPVHGSNVIVTKQALGPNNGTNAWIQKHENGRLYLLDADGKPSNYCLDARFPGNNPNGPAFPSANGCLVYLNVDIPQRQTQLWTVIRHDDGKNYSLQNVGFSLSFPEGANRGPYHMDSGGVAQPGSVCQMWQQSGCSGPNQSWQLEVLPR